MTDFAKTYDIIIIGGGAVGLSSAYHCAVKEGKKILLLERFAEFGNQYGSSPGYSRQFRVCYAEKNLCELALETSRMWDKLMEEFGDSTLLQRTGCLWFGDASVHNSEGNINQAIVNLKELGQNEPDDFKILDGESAILNEEQFSFVSNAVKGMDSPKALFTSDGGTVNVPALVNRYVQALESLRGEAELINNACVTKIDHTSSNTIEVCAEIDGIEKKFYSAKVILTPGVYVNEVLSLLSPSFPKQINLIIHLWCTTYFKAERIPSDPSKWPIWYYFGPKAHDDGRDGAKNYNTYYGFPSEPKQPGYLRVAPAFTSRKEFDFDLFPPNINKRPVDDDALKFTKNFVETSMPTLNSTLIPEKKSTCVACFAKLVNADEEDKGAGFVLDFLPGTEKRISVFTGGWAMKYVPIIGKILADFAVRGETKYKSLIQPMNINRGVLRLLTKFRLR